ncbi:hypothetical protein Tco_1278946, partial [Tanacetum coccineum]
RLVQGASSSCATHQKTVFSKDYSPFLTISDDDEGLPDVLELQDANACHLKISDITPLAWRGHLDNQLDVELIDLHDRCYARQAVCEVLKEREKARDKECEELRAKCKAAMTEFDKNPVVVVIRKKIVALLGEVKEHKASLERMLLESKKWANYQVSLSTLESKVASLEAEKTKLEATEASLRQELENARFDRWEFV